MKAIQDTGFKLVALGAGGDGYEAPLLEAGIDYQDIPIDRKGLNPFADLHLFFHLLKRIRRDRPTLIHLFTIKPVIYGGLAARLTHVPTVATITGLGYVFTSGGPVLRVATRCVYRIALRQARTVFFQNSEDRDYFLMHRLVRAVQVQLVPGSGVDTTWFAPPAKREISVPIFLMIGRLIAEKGVFEYIEASQRVRSEYPNVRCLLVGAPDERNPTAVSSEVIHHAVHRGDIEWGGWADDVRPWLAQADIVVLPSYREGLPRSLLEAASMERAIIATDTAGCRAVVVPGVNGVLVPIRNAAALAEAMIKLLKNPDLIRQLGRAGRQRVIQLFDERIVIARTLASYESAGAGIS